MNPRFFISWVTVSINLNILLFLIFPFVAFSATALPELKRYGFNALNSKVLQGTSTQKKTDSYNCTGEFKEHDQIGSFLLVAQFYQNGCYTDGRYNHKQYPVDQGKVTEGNGISFDAYRIHEPMNKATEFLASEHIVYYRFSSREDYVIYELSGDSLRKLATVSEAEIDTSKFVPVSGLTVSKIKGERTLLFVPAAQKLSVFTMLSPGVEGAHLKSTTIGDVLKYRYDINGKLFDTSLDFMNGPNDRGNIYALTKQFFMLTSSKGDIGTVWQDQKDALLYLTWVSNDLQSPRTVSLPNSRSEDLAAVAYDKTGTVFYLTIQAGSGADTDEARTATLYAVDTNGQLLRRKNLDNSKSGFNMVEFTNNNVATMHYLNGQLGLILARKMHESSDGLNHQGAIAVVFDANNLNVLGNLGQTSGHSLGNILLTSNNEGKFLALDLGDNYPRGVNLHKFSKNKKSSRVVYTFKTEHGTKANSPAEGTNYPIYSEISNADTTYYQWSNDNRMYTELGGVIESNNGYAVIFAGEMHEGHSLDNRRIGKNLNDPRNIGMVLVQKDFENASGEGNEVSDDLILTSGITETGEFYTFGGQKVKQRNTGVVWLTNYRDKSKENASRIKAVPLADGHIIVLWEKWSDRSYVNTYAMKITDYGEIVTPPVELGNMVRLNRTDDPMILGNKIYLAAGNKKDAKLEMVIINLEKSKKINGLSGSWYDPAYDGSGFNLIQTSNGFLIYFYGYKNSANGDAQWLLSEVISDPIRKGQTVTAKVFSTLANNGGNFMTKPTTPNFGLTDWGQAEITINSCRSGVIKLTGIDGTLTHNIVPLAPIDGLACTETNNGAINYSAPNIPVGSMGGFSGSWYDPIYSGSGFNLIQATSGTIIYFYGYKGNASGQPQWLLSDVISSPILKGQKLTTKVFSGFIGNGGSFTAKPTASRSGLTDWGQAQIVIHSCNAGVIRLTGNDGTVTHNIVPLAMINGVACNE